MITERNDTELIRNEILVVSFGTTSEESRRVDIGAVEQAIDAAVNAPGEIARATGEDCGAESHSCDGGYIVRRCFTSQMILSIIAKKEGIAIDNIREALERAVSDGVKNLIVQPTHIMKGLEYDKLCDALADYADAFDKLAIGDPLLTSDEDFSRAADALVEASASYEDGETALVLMGHGTEAAANGIYEKMQRVFKDKGRNDYYVGTVEAEPSLDDVIEAVNAGSYRRVVLRPLMLVAGNHAINDMSSPDNPDSWYSRFTAAGYETTCINQGLGQIPAIRDIYVDHVRHLE